MAPGEATDRLPGVVTRSVAIPLDTVERESIWGPAVVNEAKHNKFQGGVAVVRILWYCPE